METQNIVNSLNNQKEYSKFATKKWYVIGSELKDVYSKDNIIKFLTKSIESRLCDYSDANILVTGNIAVTRTAAAAGNDPLKRKEPLIAATQVAFKNCASLEIVEHKSMMLCWLCKLY